MVDFVLDKTTGDLDLGDNNSKGLQLHVDFGDEAVQRMQQALTLNLGEWFANVNAGLPYIRNPNEDVGQGLRYFLGEKSPNIGSYIAATLDEYILSFTFVNDLISSNYDLDRKTRTYRYDSEIKLINGEVISFPFDTFLEI